MSKLTRALAGLVALAAAISLGACGGGDDEESGDTTASGGEPVEIEFWHGQTQGPAELLQEMIDATQRRVTGTARLKLHKGGVQVVGRKSSHSLYRHDFVTFEKDDVYNQADATGFIRLHALRLRLRSMREAGG